MWNCANNLFGYCDGEPDWEQPPAELKLREDSPGFQQGGSCKLSPATCGRFKKSSELVDSSTLSGDSYRHTSIYNDGTEKSASKPKKKTGKTEKPEKEQLQGRLM